MTFAKSPRAHEDIHDQVKEKRDGEREPPAVGKLIEIGNEKHALDGKEQNADNGRSEYRFLGRRVVKDEQRRRHKHVECDSQPIG